MGNEQSGEKPHTYRNYTMYEGEDRLKLGSVEAITSQLDETTQEKVVFSCKIQKQNRFSVWQDREFLLTSQRLCNLKKADLRRSIPITKIKALTKNTMKGNLNGNIGNITEFLVHVEGETDYRYSCNWREAIIMRIKE